MSEIAQMSTFRMERNMKMTKSTAIAAFLLGSTMMASAHHTHDPVTTNAAEVRAKIALGGDDEYRLRHVLQDIMTDTSNEWDDVLRRWRHRTDPNDVHLQADYQKWWDLLNERVEEKMVGREFATDGDRLTVWMAIAHSVDNDMPLAPVNEVSKH